MKHRYFMLKSIFINLSKRIAMKKSILLFTLLFMLFTGKSFAQEKKSQEATPIKPALLVIDIQNAFLPMIPDRDKEVGLYYINSLIGLFRKSGYPVICIYQYSEEYGVKQGTEQFEFPSSVQIKPEDPRIIKTYPDGFNKTSLDSTIKATGSNTLFLCGLSAVGCVLATWIGAQNHDYQAFMVKDAIMSPNSEFTNQVEDMFDAIGYDVVKFIVEGIK
jgi:nicotinamidase-related amidase